jgi:hypothetical protein
MFSSPNSPLFQCCMLLSMKSPKIVGEKMELERFYDSVNVMLSLQVRMKLPQLLNHRSSQKFKLIKKKIDYNYLNNIPTLSRVGSNSSLISK